MAIDRNTLKSIGTTAEIISEEPQQERVLITIINTSSDTQVITIGIGVMAEENKGIVLSPGGFYQEVKGEGFSPTSTFISAISDQADGQLSIQERLI
jgi:hypothetical protein